MASYPKLAESVTQQTARQERAAAERAIAILIDRYEAVRTTPGPDRAAAGRLLEAALQAHGGTVWHRHLLYRWSRAEASIVRSHAARYDRVESTKVWAPGRAATALQSVRSRPFGYFSDPADDLGSGRGVAL